MPPLIAHQLRLCPRSFQVLTDRKWPVILCMASHLQFLLLCATVARAEKKEHLVAFVRLCFQHAGALGSLINRRSLHHALFQRGIRAC